jgi:hypothetical protein
MLSEIAGTKGGERIEEEERRDAVGDGRNISDTSGTGREVNHDESDNFESKSEGQLLEDTKVVGSMLSSALRSSMRITTMVSPNDDDPLTSHKITFPDDDLHGDISAAGRNREGIDSAKRVRNKEKSAGCHALGIGRTQRDVNEVRKVDSRSKGIADPTDRGTRTVGRSTLGREDSGDLERNLSEKGQSRSELDNQGCDSQQSLDKSEGQLLEDVKVDGSMLSSALRSSMRISTLTSPNDDDPLVYVKAVNQIRHEKSLRLSHVDVGGGDVSQVNSEDNFEFERPYFGPSHVDDGGGAELNLGLQFSNCWRCQSKIPQIELPTEIRKLELKKRMEVSEQQLVTDPKFHAHAWRIKNFFGLQRESALRNFLREVYKEEHHDSQRVFKEFALNDYLEASDELHGLVHPMRSWWRPCWEHRSSADTVGSGMSVVGTGLVSGAGLTGTCVTSRHPLQTSVALSLCGGL